MDLPETAPATPSQVNSVWLPDLHEGEGPTSAIYQAVGAASVCWESMEGTGTFLDDRARGVVAGLERYLSQHGAVLLTDEALVAEVKRRNAERGLDAPLEGQTWIGDRWVPQECGIGRCAEWQRGDVLHRHWRDQATGVSLITPDATQPGGMPATTGEVKAR